MAAEWSALLVAMQLWGVSALSLTLCIQSNLQLPILWSEKLKKVMNEFRLCGEVVFYSVTVAMC